MSPATLDTVVFDIGGVLVDWDPRHLYRRLFDGDEARTEWFLSTVCTPEWNHSMDAGRPRSEAVAELVAAHPEHADAIRAWTDRWAEMIVGEVPGTAEVLERLAGRAVRLLALTNWSAETFPAARARFRTLQRFEAVVVSGEHQLAKPDPRLFQVLVRDHRVVPARAVYVDDRHDNVEVAADLGFTALHFTTATGLATDLQRLGVLGPQPAAGP